jgi:hypothetical protein
MCIKKQESVLPSIAVIFALVGIPTYAALIPQQAVNQEQNQYAVVFPPQTSHNEALQKTIKAGGLPVRSTFFDFILITASNDEKYPLKLKEQGALLLLAPIIKGGCYIENKSRLSRQTTQGL